MIDELDEALKKLLNRELPNPNGEVDIQFDLPRREWSARISRPTLNIFLYDIRENQKLRQTQPMWETEIDSSGNPTQHRKPVRVDLHYMLTAWATEPEDEHRLLSRAVMVFFRFSHLPEDLLSGNLLGQAKQIPITAAQYSELNNSADLWSVLDNEMRPAISLTITLSIDPYAPLPVTLVRQREIRFGQPAEPAARRLAPHAGSAPDTFWSIGGRLTSQQPLEIENISLSLVERHEKVALLPDGQFVIGRLRAGAYTLEAAVGSNPVRRYSITVPAADVVLEI
jgi:hypothetical protein